MEVTKLNHALKFKQSYWLRPYMQLNTEKSKESRNKFEDSFFTLMINSHWYSFFCEIKIFSENLASISSQKRSILWNKPASQGNCFGIRKASHVQLLLQRIEKTPWIALSYISILTPCYMRSNTETSMRFSDEGLENIIKGAKKAYGNCERWRERIKL